MRPSHSVSRLFVSLVSLSLVVAACSQPAAKPTSAPIVVPTKAPIHLPTVAPSLAPTQAPKATPAPTTAPKPTALPTLAPTQEPVQTTPAFGTSQSLGAFALLPSQADRMSEYDTSTPKTGDMYVIINLSVKNMSATATISFDPSHLALVDMAGNLNVTPISLTTLKDELKIQDLKPGAQVEGSLAYEAPAGLSGLELVFKGDTTSAQSVRWMLPAPALGTELRLGSLSLKPLTSERMNQSGEDKPKDGDVYLIVHMTVRNTSTSDTIKFDPLQMFLTDAAGLSLAPISLRSMTDQLQSVELKPGEEVDGLILYEAPKNVSTWDLMFKSTDNQQALWQIAG